ncbi:hypothetical protein Tco_0237289 [Tanacetum coccineum]
MHPPKPTSGDAFEQIEHSTSIIHRKLTGAEILNELCTYVARIMSPRRFKKKSVRKIVEKRVARAIEKYERLELNPTMLVDLDQQILKELLHQRPKLMVEATSGELTMLAIVQQCTSTPCPCPPMLSKCHKLGHQEGDDRTRIPVAVVNILQKCDMIWLWESRALQE